MSNKVSTRAGTVRPTKKRAGPKRAYVTGPHLNETGPVRRLLEARGLTAFSPDELDLPGQTLTDVMREAMEQADIVVAVVDSSESSNLVFYELGLSQSLKKPTLVLLSPGASSEPWQAFGVPYLRFDPLKPENVGYGLDLFLAAPPKGGRPRSSAAKQTNPIGDQADGLLARLRLPELTPLDFEQMIADAIRASGVPIVSVSQEADTRNVDLAVWSNDLAPWIMNPLVIELKLRPLTATELGDVANQLSASVASSGLPWGLLIYHGPPVERLSVTLPPNVLVMHAEGFLDGLRDTGFSDLVKGLRKRRVHGEP
jgi:hypothetical protein